MQAEPILISGVFDAPKFRSTSLEIVRLDKKTPIVFVVESLETGGDHTAARVFVEIFNQENKTRQVSIKLYGAVGIAAYMAVALNASHRKMMKGSSVTLLRCKGTDHSSNYYNEALLAAAEKRDFHTVNIFSLNKGGRLVLSAVECLEMGLVNELF